MLLAAKVFAGLAAALHVVFFLFESVLFTRPDVYARFKLTAEQAETVRVWALNQGFYNLLLAIGCFVGIALAGTKPRIGWTLIVHACLVMVGAGIVLVASEPSLVGGAVVQAGPPTVGLILAGLAWKQAQAPS